MATPAKELGQNLVQDRVLDVCRGLLDELGSHRALAAVRADAHLDRELGLGSLERVELMVRLDAEFDIRLPDRPVAEADTVKDLVAAVLAEMINGGAADTLDDSARVRLTDSATPLIDIARYAKGGAGAATRLHGVSDAGVEAAQTLTDVLRYRARADADRPHLHLYDEDRAAEPITFAQLLEHAQTVAHALERRGVAPGHAVALMLPTSAEFFYTFAGILFAGAIPVPIYPPFRADRIEEYAARQCAILQNAEARLLVTFRQAELVAKLLAPRVASLLGVVNAAHLVEPGRTGRKEEDGRQPVRPHRAHAEDIAMLQYTSGSTGSPKGVVLTHANLLANIRAIGAALEVRPGDVGVSWLPLYHDMGLIGAWMVLLYFGLPLAVMSPLAFLTRPERWLWAVHRHRGTMAAAPNFAYELCVRKVADKDIEGLDLSSWRAALNGAEPVNPETVERFTARFARYGFRAESMIPVYGLAEASLAVTVPVLGHAPRVDGIERETFERVGRAVPVAENAPREPAGIISFVSVGRPVPGHEVRIADAEGRDAGERTEGALWFRGPSATSGYYRNEPATRLLFPEKAAGGEPFEASRNRWVDSGDRAYRAEGEIYVTGRVKDIIIKAGRNLYPHEIEEVAGRVPQVRKGCVVAFGVSEELTGTERLVVVAETRDRAAAHDASARAGIAQAIAEAVSSALGVPPDVVELLAPNSIPKTSSGKLRREETKRLYRAGELGHAARPAWWQVTRLAAAGVLRAAARGILSGLEVLYGVYAAVVFVLWLVPTWFVVLLTPGRGAAAWITSTALKLYMALVGCRIRVEGRELLRGHEARICVSNHTSYFDVLALMAALGVNYRFVSKVEVRSMPFIGTFLRKLGHVWFDRSDAQARLRQAEQIEELLRRGISVWVFPEGTFTPHEGVRAFQLGAFKAAVTTGRPILPVALRGTRRFLRDETSLPRPTSVTITLCPPLKPAPNAASDWHEIVRLRDAARTMIAAHSGEELL